MECIDQQGEVRPRYCNHYKNKTLFDPIKLIEVSTLEVVDITCEICEASVDTPISTNYFCETIEVGPYNKRPEYWLILENLIRSHIYSIDVKYYPDIVEAALNVRLQKSKFSGAIGSTTKNYESCSFFLTQANEVCASVASANASYPRGIWDAILSKIWQINNTTDKRTMDTTTELNRCGKNKSLLRNVRANDQMS